MHERGAQRHTICTLADHAQWMLIAVMRGASRERVSEIAC